MSTDDIHRDISEFYGKTVQRTSDLKFQSCVCSVPRRPRHSQILSQFAPDVLSKYYGCGSPIPECLTGRTVVDLGCGTGRDVFLASVLAGRSGLCIGVDMTDEQLAVGRKSVAHHMKTFPEAAPVEFRKSFIESLDLVDGSVDVVISNCVINLVPDKRAVFREIFRVLREGGEVFISDIFTDRRLKKAARDNKQLVGECIGNAIDIHTFQVMMKDAGFGAVWPVTVSHFGAGGMSPELIDPETNFFKLTFSAYKLTDRTWRWEGHVATYTGGIVDCEDKFDFDANHVFPAGIGVPVCSMIAEILHRRYGDHFAIEKVEPVTPSGKERSFTETVYGSMAGESPHQSPSCCCCAGQDCC
jgi:ubiquinone/menaquinone biosynthesis C-methylase UbiE